MHFHVVTLFPEMIESSLSIGVVGQALKDQRVKLSTLTPREFTSDVHHSVDDRPFGGGDGMIMMGEMLKKSIEALRTRGAGPDAKVIHLSPRGRPLTDTLVRELAEQTAASGHVILIASRYGGVDQRFLNECVDQEISIGDYILSGGELGALVLMDAMSRHSPGVVGNDRSIEQESFADGLLEHPQFTRPREWEQRPVPDALLTGHHLQIQRWKAELSLLVTLDRRPDLLSDDKIKNVRVLGEPLSRRFLEGARQTVKEMNEEERKNCGLSLSESLSLRLDAIILSAPKDSKPRSGAQTGSGKPQP